MYPHLNEDQILEEVENIFKHADLDGNGELDYSEWAVATMNKEHILTDKKLKATFELFDKVR